MKKPDRMTSEPDDKDLAELFAATGKESVPAELDLQILAAAQEAISHEQAAREQHGKDADSPRKSPPAGARFRSWFAVAATLIIAVAVTPLLLRAPESTLQAPVPSVSDRPATKAPAEMIMDGATIEAASDVTSEATNETTVEPAAQSPESDNAAFSGARSLELDQLQAPGAQGNALKELQKRSEPASDSPSAFSSDAIVDEDRGQEIRSDVEPQSDRLFRRTPQTWLAFIRQLIQKQKLDEALSEYEEFRSEHPDFEPEFKFPEQ